MFMLCIPCSAVAVSHTLCCIVSISVLLKFLSYIFELMNLYGDRSSQTGSLIDVPVAAVEPTSNAIDCSTDRHCCVDGSEKTEGGGI